MLTFSEFQNTRQFVSNLGDAISDENLEGCFGYVYLGEYYIEFLPNSGIWYLPLSGREEHGSRDLEFLERKLYDWCIKEAETSLERHTIVKRHLEITASNDWHIGMREHDEYVDTINEALKVAISGIVTKMREEHTLAAFSVNWY